LKPQKTEGRSVIITCKALPAVGKNSERGKWNGSAQTAFF
jgi:hypothetical protein